MPARTVLMNPGPVTLSPRVRDALTRGDWCHREPEFAALTQEINAGLARVYPEMAADFDAVLLTTSGTGAVEAMLAGFAPADTSTLVVANGVYGERMAEILAAHGRPHLVARHDWTDPPDLAGLVALLDEHPDITHIACVQHETTTGRLNDIDALGRVCRARSLGLLLDGVSSFGAEAIAATDWNLTAVAATANKCLHGVPGIAFVLGRKSAFAAGPPGDEPPTSVYLDPFRYHRAQHGDGYSPFTQAIQAAFALREALAELEEAGGWAVRRDEYRRRMARVTSEMTGQSIDSLLNENDYSCVLKSFVLPDGVGYQALHDRLKAAGFVIYAGQGNLGEQIFRISVMGDIRESDLEAFCATFRAAMRELRP